MQFSLATLLPLLTAAEVATAWQIIGYQSTSACNDQYRNRVLRGGDGQSNRCYTFGQDMPGVSCTEYAKNGAAAQGCTYNLPVTSIRVGTGELCAFYNGPDCTAGSGGTIIRNRVNDCISFGAGTTVGSYKCSTA